MRGEIAIVGLARSGRAVAKLLARTGNSVYASDASRNDALERTRQELEREGVDVELGGHDEARIRRASLIVVSPGVPPDAPVLVDARHIGIDVVSEVEIALRMLPKLRYIAITGTNGKTTTTALVAHLLKSLDLRAAAAGNIGTALSEIALEPEPPDWVALEVSSFQLHDTPGILPAVGVLTNVSPNHLDRYAFADEYYADKKLLLRNASAESNWIVNRDDAIASGLSEGAAGKHFGFSTTGESDAWYDRETDRFMVLGQPIASRADLQLFGDHNVANALAALLAVMVAHPNHQTPGARRRLGAALRTFHAIEHRIETVGEFGNVLWINDSKSTNVASTLVALRGMTRPTVLLLGGRHKGEPYTALRPEVARIVRAIVAYGEAAAEITRDLGGAVTVEQGGTTFSEVVERARRLAKPGDVVLLSPACSSFDMFANYEQRGHEFKRLARA